MAMAVPDRGETRVLAAAAAGAAAAAAAAAASDAVGSGSREAGAEGASTAGAGLIIYLCTADQYISIILSGRLFRDLYADRGLEPRLLSRSVEDSATVCSVLIPWNSCGMTQATVLGVSTFVYAPYCIFNIVSPLMSLLVAAVGWNIKRKK